MLGPKRAGAAGGAAVGGKRGSLFLADAGGCQGELAIHPEWGCKMIGIPSDVIKHVFRIFQLVTRTFSFSWVIIPFGIYSPVDSNRAGFAHGNILAFSGSRFLGHKGSN